MSEGIEAVMYHMESDYESEVVSDILDSKAIALGAPTMMNKPFPRIGNLMYWLDCLNFKGTTSEKNALIFSSKGWGGGAIAKLQRDLESEALQYLIQWTQYLFPMKISMKRHSRKGLNLQNQ